MSEENVVSMKSLFAAAALVFAASTAQAAPDLDEGRKKAEQVCAACHGLDGNSEVVTYPRIGGQHADYIVQALEDYRSGARRNAIMAGFAATLSDADRRNLAAWYSNQPSTVYTVSRDR